MVEDAAALADSEEDVSILRCNSPTADDDVTTADHSVFRSALDEDDVDIAAEDLLDDEEIENILDGELSDEDER